MVIYPHIIAAERTLFRLRVRNARTRSVPYHTKRTDRHMDIVRFVAVFAPIYACKKTGIRKIMFMNPEKGKVWEIVWMAASAAAETVVGKRQ